MTIFLCVRTTWQNCPLVYMYLTFAISILNLQYRDWILTSKRKYTYEWTIDARSCWFCENIYIYYICAGLWIPREYDFLLKMHENEGYIIHHMTILSAPSCLCISVRFVCFHDSVSKNIYTFRAPLYFLWSYGCGMSGPYIKPRTHDSCLRRVLIHTCHLISMPNNEPLVAHCTGCWPSSKMQAGQPIRSWESS